MTGTFKEKFGKFWRDFSLWGLVICIILGFAVSWHILGMFLNFIGFIYIVLSFCPASIKKWWEEATGVKPWSARTTLIVLGIIIVVLFILNSYGIQV